MIIFTISLDPAPLNEIISDPGGSGSGSRTWGRVGHVRQQTSVVLHYICKQEQHSRRFSHVQYKYFIRVTFLQPNLFFCTRRGYLFITESFQTSWTQAEYGGGFRPDFHAIYVRSGYEVMTSKISQERKRIMISSLAPLNITNYVV